MKPVLCLTVAANFILCLFCGCDLKSVPAPPAYSFYLQNNSQDTFVFMISISFPDTTLDTLALQQLSIGNTGVRRSSVIYPHIKTELNLLKSSFPNFATSGTLELFLISLDTLQQYSWQEINSKYLIARRYDLTYKDIIINDSTITYP